MTPKTFLRRAAVGLISAAGGALGLTVSNVVLSLVGFALVLAGTVAMFILGYAEGANDAA